MIQPITLFKLYVLCLFSLLYISYGKSWLVKDVVSDAYPHHCEVDAQGTTMCYHPPPLTLNNQTESRHHHLLHPFYRAYLQLKIDGARGGSYSSAACQAFSVATHRLPYQAFLSASSSSNSNNSHIAFFLVLTIRECVGPGLGNLLSDYYEVVAFAAYHGLVLIRHHHHHHHDHQGAEVPGSCAKGQIIQQLPVLYIPGNLSSSTWAASTQPWQLNCQSIRENDAWEAASAYQWRYPAPIHRLVHGYFMPRLMTMMMMAASTATASSATARASSAIAGTGLTTIAIHIRCGDNLPFGLLPWSYYAAILQPLLLQQLQLLHSNHSSYHYSSSHHHPDHDNYHHKPRHPSSSASAFIIERIVLHSDVSAKLPSSSSSSQPQPQQLSRGEELCSRYVHKLNVSLYTLLAATAAALNYSTNSSHQLHQPPLPVIELHHDSLLADYLALHFANITICSISTFCTSSVFGRDGGGSGQQQRSFLPIPLQPPPPSAAASSASASATPKQPQRGGKRSGPAAAEPEHMHNPYKMVLGYQQPYHDKMQLVPTEIIKLENSKNLDVNETMKRLFG